MRYPNISPIGRHVVALGVVVCSLSSAACSDVATEPRPTLASGLEPMAGRSKPSASTRVTVSVVDVFGTEIDELASVKFRLGDPPGETEPPEPDANPPTEFNFRDNGSGDLDPAVGRLAVMLPEAASYKACVVGATNRFVAVVGDPTYPDCSFLVPAVKDQAALSPVFVRRKPTITWHTLDAAGRLIGGATMAVTTPQGTRLTVTDGERRDDQSPSADGQINFTLGNGPGMYSWCETNAPKGFKLANPSCGSFAAAWETDAMVRLAHESIK